MKTPTQRTVSPSAGPVTVQPLQASKARRYEAPSILSFDGDKVLQEIGPAQGYGQTPAVDSDFHSDMS